MLGPRAEAGGNLQGSRPWLDRIWGVLAPRVGFGFSRIDCGWGAVLFEPREGRISPSWAVLNAFEQRALSHDTLLFSNLSANDPNFPNNFTRLHRKRE